MDALAFREAEGLATDRFRGVTERLHAVFGQPLAISQENRVRSTSARFRLELETDELEPIHSVLRTTPQLHFRAATLIGSVYPRNSMRNRGACRRSIDRALLWLPPLVLQAFAVFLMTTAGAGVFDWWIAEERRMGALAFAAGVGVAGAAFFWSASWLGEWQRRRIGLFLGIFATGRPEYTEDRIGRSLAEFKKWAQEQHPNAYVLDGIRRDLQTRNALDSAILEVTRTLNTAQQLAGSDIHDVSLWFGGRLDAVFWFGMELGRGLGVTGPVWILSDSAAEYEETFAPAGTLAGSTEGLYPAQRKGRTPRSSVNLAPGYTTSRLVTRTPGPVIQRLWCQYSGHWAECSHDAGAHSGDLVLAIDTTTEDNSAGNRIPSAIARSSCFSKDTVLALVTTRALPETPEAHASFMASVESCYEQAKAKFNNPGADRQLIALAGPTSIAALAGSTLRFQGTWHTLNFVRGAYEMSFEREQAG